MPTTMQSRINSSLSVPKRQVSASLFRASIKSITDSHSPCSYMFVEAIFVRQRSIDRDKVRYKSLHYYLVDVILSFSSIYRWHFHSQRKPMRLFGLCRPFRRGLQRCDNIRSVLSIASTVPASLNLVSHVAVYV